MARSRSARTGCVAAMAAADRIKLLLELVEKDDFLHEILSTASRMLEGSEEGRSLLRPYPVCGRPQRTRANAAPVLDANYHEAKKKALKRRDSARVRLV